MVISMKVNLSDTQKEVVDYEGQHLLVLAGAGSGKTRVLTEKVRKRIESIKKGQKVLVITFSNKAASELVDRLRLSVDDDFLNKTAFVGTIHKFCLDILLSRGHMISLPNNLQICESYNDRIELFKRAVTNNPYFVKKYLSGSDKENEKQISKLYENLSNAKRNLKNPSDYDENQAIKSVYEDYEDSLLNQGMIDFDDILRYTYKILIEHDNIANLYRNIYTEIFVDEAQDLNRAQYEIIKVLTNDKSKTTFVGDPNQSIYGFNGSSSVYMENKYLIEFNAEKKILNENFRSSISVINAAKKIEPTFDVAGILPYKGEFDIFKFNDEAEEAKFVVSKIKHLLKNGHKDIEENPVKPENIAVLARNRFVFNFLEKELMDNEIEYSLKVSSVGGINSESNYIVLFEQGLKLLVNERNMFALNEVNRILKKELNNLHEIKKYLKLSSSELYKNIIHAWDNIIVDSDLKFDKVIKILEKYPNHVEDENERLMIYNDLNLWTKVWKNFVSKSLQGNRSLSDFLRSISMGELRNEELHGIILSTVHMSKGLEFDVVFILGVNDGVFPDYRAVRDLDYSRNESQMNEERHNFFVAITRSKRLCYISYPLKKNTPWGIKPQKASRFLDNFD